MSIAIKDFTGQQITESLTASLDAEGLTRLDNLVVTDHENDVVERIAESLSPESALVHRLSKSEWPATLATMVKWAAENRVKQIVIVAHSESGDQISAEATAHYEDASREAVAPSYEKIIAGARAVEQELARAKEQFATTMCDLVESPELADVSCDDEFQLLPLFHIAHSDVFLRFNFSTSTFVPLSP